MPSQKPPAGGPPHVSLKSLRKVSGMKLDDLAQKVADVLGLDEPMNRGTLSLIENGKRGASQQMLDAIAAAYGLDSGEITTAYEPRMSRIHKAAS